MEKPKNISDLLWKILSNKEKDEITIPGVLQIRFLKEGDSKNLPVIIKEKAVQQMLIDYALHVISKKLLKELLKEQEEIREEIRKKINKAEMQKITHEQINAIISNEKEISNKVKEWEEYFLEISQYAEKNGLYVHKMEWGCIYSLYNVLRIDFIESISINIRSEDKT